MMVSIETLGMAVSSFMESEIIPKTHDSSRFKMGVATMFAPKWIERKIHENADMLEMNGLLTESGMIDLDCAKRLAHSLIDKYGPYKDSIMKMTISIGKEDIDKIANLAMSN